MMELSYRRHRFPPVVIQHAVWLYLRLETGSHMTLRWSKRDSNSRSHPLTRRQTHGSDRMNGAERDTVVGSGSLVTLDPGAAKREIARSFPVRPWALSQARGA